MKLGSHCDYRGRLSDQRTHCVLCLTGVCDDFGQGAIVPDGTGKYERRPSLYKRSHNPVFNHPLFDGCFDRSSLSNQVDRVQVLVMAQLGVFFCVNVLSECGAEDRCLYIVSRQGVSCENSVDESLVDNGGQRVARILVEGHCRSKHPEQEAVFAIVFEQVIEFVVVI